MLDAMLAAGLAALVVTAMISDARAYRIPNWISLAILALFAIRVAAWWLGAATFPVAPHWHVAVGAMVFAVTYLTFAYGLFGGGDVKLLSAVSLWAGPTFILPLLWVMAIAGGLLGVLIILARRILAPTSETPASGNSASGRAASWWLGPLPRWAGEGRCPYGIAIGLGALATIWPQ